MTADQEAWYCRACGKPQPRDGRFCQFCGQPIIDHVSGMSPDSAIISSSPQAAASKSAPGKTSSGGIAGGIGALVVIAGLWYVGSAVWHAITPSSTPVIHVCMENHYSVSHGCSRDDHTLDQASADLAYIVVDVPDPDHNNLDGHKIVRDNPDGTTYEVAILADDVSNANHRRVTRLSSLWGTEGESITAGSYEVSVDYGLGNTIAYKLTIH